MWKMLLQALHKVLGGEIKTNFHHTWMRSVYQTLVTICVSADMILTWGVVDCLPDINDAEQRGSSQDGACLSIGDPSQRLVVDRYQVVAHLYATVVTNGTRWDDGLHNTTIDTAVHGIHSHSWKQHDMMTSSNGKKKKKKDIIKWEHFRVTGPLCREFTGHRWIPLTKASDAELWCFLRFAAWMNGWVNNREAGDLRRHHSHYDIIVMVLHWSLGTNYLYIDVFVQHCGNSNT